MALKLKPGMKLERLKLHPGAMKKLRTGPEVEDLLDRIAATVANAATKNAAGNRPSGGLDLGEAEFAVDGATSAGKRGRYRASVRTANFEAVFAEYNHDSLTMAFDEVARKLGGGNA